MNKVLVLVLADIDTTGDLGRVVNALQSVREFKEAGDDVRLAFDGAGTRWIGQLGSPEHKYHGLFESVKDRTGACGYCATAFGVKPEVERLGVPLLDEFDGHPSLRRAVVIGDMHGAVSTDGHAHRIPELARAIAFTSPLA